MQSQEEDQTATYGAQDSQAGESTARMDDGHSLYDDDSMLDDPPVMTPRPKLSGKHAFADYPSQYEDIRRELKGTKPSEEDEDMTEMPTTPATQQRIPDMSMTPSSSPFPATSHLPETTRQRPTDPLLHRVLDKNYRIQATPHTAQRRPERQDTTHRTPVTKRAWQNDSSPMSSPVMAPQLHSEIFSSPIARGFHTNAPRTPGVSVQTPAKGQARDDTTRRFSAHMPKDEIDWQSDSDDGNPFGISPPKTIQFAIPQSRLLQTPGKLQSLYSESERGGFMSCVMEYGARLTAKPAREASKRIVDDLLRTAGGGDDTEQSDSPSMVKMRNDLDDTF